MFSRSFATVGWSLFRAPIRHPVNSPQGKVTERGKVIHRNRRCHNFSFFTNSRENIPTIRECVGSWRILPMGINEMEYEILSHSSVDYRGHRLNGIL
jgi:hypothetical protein